MNICCIRKNFKKNTARLRNKKEKIQYTQYTRLSFEFLSLNVGTLLKRYVQIISLTLTLCTDLSAKLS